MIRKIILGLYNMPIEIFFIFSAMNHAANNENMISFAMYASK